MFVSLFKPYLIYYRGTRPLHDSCHVVMRHVIQLCLRLIHLYNSTYNASCPNIAAQTTDAILISPKVPALFNEISVPLKNKLYKKLERLFLNSSYMSMFSCASY